jgi:hypothetical protein
MKSYWNIPFVVLLATLTACSKTDNPATAQTPPAAQAAAKSDGQIKPTITLSRERIPRSGWTKVFGKGFTPKANVQSHLRRPDGTEFREIPILTDANGEFTHDIDTLLLLRGVHDVWVIDSTTGLTSNVVHFTATDEQGPAENPTR